MTEYYKDDYLEATLFLFFKGGKILIEHRPKNGGKETFIPNGKIDVADLQGGGDYRLVAMNREICEEFGDSVAVQKHLFLGEFIVKELKIKFYGYLITGWEGEFPDYTVEEGERYADLQWIPIEEYKKYLKFPSAIHFVEKAMEVLV